MYPTTLLSALVVVTASLPASQPKDRWETYQFADRAFSVSFPSRPTETIQQTPSGLKYPVASCKVGSGVLGVSWMPREGNQKSNSKTLSRNMLDGFEGQGPKATLLFVNEITYNGLPAADLGGTVIRNGRMIYMRQRMIATKTHVIQIMLTDGASGPIEAWVSDCVFNSLKVPERPKAK